MTVVTKTINPYIQHLSSGAVAKLNLQISSQKGPQVALEMRLDNDAIWMDPPFAVFELPTILRPIEIAVTNNANLDEIFFFNFRLDTKASSYDAWLTDVPQPIDVSKFDYHYEFPNIQTISLTTLPKILTNEIEALLQKGSDAFVWVKFDVLARGGTDWFLADPRLGVKR